MTTSTERKYALTRLATGDYLLPSNDAQTLYRIRSYVDGPSFGLDWPRDRTLWHVMRWTGELDRAGFIDDEFLESDRWDGFADGFNTRREAIDYALAAT